MSTVVPREMIERLLTCSQNEGGADLQALCLSAADVLHATTLKLEQAELDIARLDKDHHTFDREVSGVAEAMLTFEESSHTYRVDGRRVPSVTQVLGSLFRWDLVPPDVLERKRQIGKAIHHAIHLELAGFTVDARTIDPAVLPYHQAWQLFCSECSFEPVLVEYRGYNERHDYAWTLDSWGLLQGRPALPDWKTAFSLNHAAVGAQTAAYLMGLVEQGIASLSDARFALQLLPTGRYKLHRYVSVSDDCARFLRMREAFVEHAEAA